MRRTNPTILFTILTTILSLGVACAASHSDDGSSDSPDATNIASTTGSGKPGSGAGGDIGTGIGAATSGSSGGANGGEICGDGLDNNGDGHVDEGCSCDAGAMQPCFVGDPAQAGVGACVFGTQTCEATGEVGTYAWGDCTGYGTPSAETCNKIDDNCDGTVDEGCPTAADCMMSSLEMDFTAVCRNWKGTKHDHVDDCHVDHQCAPGCIANVVDLQKTVNDANGELSNCSFSVSGTVQMGETIRVDCTYDNIDGVPTNQIDFACTAPP